MKRGIARCSWIVALLGLSAGLAWLAPQRAPVAGRRPAAGAQPAPEPVLQLGHSGTVEALAFSPDGKTLASGSRDYTIRLWDPQTGVLKQTLVGPRDLVD